MTLSKGKTSILIVLLVLIIDQTLKIWIKTNMVLGEEYRILGNWFIIHFTENNGMAFGMELAGDYGKLILSTFRIIASAGIVYYIMKLIKAGAPKGVIISLSLILAGAIGNLIDSIFYGVIFSDSYRQVAEMFPDGGGYASLLHGRVVDMFYFPMFKGHYPDWLPFLGSKYFIFFRPVFNIADSAITVGVFWIILFQRKYFAKELD